MSVYIHQLETSVPETSYEQSFASGLMQKNIGNGEGVKRMIRNVYQHSGIRKRHSVITDFSNESGQPLFFNENRQKLPPPDTKTRNDLYTREARRLFTDLAKKLTSSSTGFNKEDVTHVITISCTGFFAPGPDYYVVKDLELPGTTRRFHIGFMGCYAAFQGLKMADSFCRSDPDAVVLVLCVELCTLHLQFSDDTDSIISASLFGDGGAGALISARWPEASDHFPETSGYSSGSIYNSPESSGRSPESSGRSPESSGRSPEPSGRSPEPSGRSPESSGQHPDFIAPVPSPVLEMRAFHSDITPTGEEDMAWTLGNEGFFMKLSKYVPDIIQTNIRPVLDNILDTAGLTPDDISRWAIHPGGRAILDKMQATLNLRDDQIAASRNVLSEYGNMSSATILFVLKKLMESRNTKQPETEHHRELHHPSHLYEAIFGMAFGPGLTIECGLFQIINPTA